MCDEKLFPECQELVIGLWLDQNTIHMIGVASVSSPFANRFAASGI